MNAWEIQNDRDAHVIGSATFSPCLRYRYTLSRTWDPGKMRIVFILLNPSTADAEQDDPTIRRCLGFARAWGCGRLDIINLFALRSTDPRLLREVDDPIGPENDARIDQVAETATLIVCAWGVHGALHHRGRAVTERLTTSGRALHCFGLTKDHHPKHPLYLPSGLVPMPFPLVR